MDRKSHISIWSVSPCIHVPLPKNQLQRCEWETQYFDIQQFQTIARRKTAEFQMWWSNLGESNASFPNVQQMPKSCFFFCFIGEYCTTLLALVAGKWKAKVRFSGGFISCKPKLKSMQNNHLNREPLSILTEWMTSTISPWKKIGKRYIKYLGVEGQWCAAAQTRLCVAQEKAHSKCCMCY